jgi:hypothetical protein
LFSHHFKPIATGSISRFQPLLTRWDTRIHKALETPSLKLDYLNLECFFYKIELRWSKFNKRPLYIVAGYRDLFVYLSWKTEVFQRNTYDVLYVCLKNTKIFNFIFKLFCYIWAFKIFSLLNDVSRKNVKISPKWTILNLITLFIMFFFITIHYLLKDEFKYCISEQWSKKTSRILKSRR